MAKTRTPCLSHVPDVGENPVVVPLHCSPFRIGRGAEVELVLGSPRVSKVHAEVLEENGSHVIRDLGSRNGTFVNGEPLEGSRRLEFGDILHIAHREIRFVLAEASEPSLDSTWADEARTYESQNLKGTRDLYRILQGKVRIVFQSIVSLHDGGVIGFEALGRHMLPDIDYDVTALFRLANDLGKAVELAQLMREVTIAEVPNLPTVGDRLFLNVHPAEMHSTRLLDELSGAVERCGGRQIVAEIHESVITSTGQMSALRKQLDARGIELAYDDFGAGSSRLMELAEVPPDFVKLDMSLIRDIDSSPRRQDLVAALVKVMRDADVRVIAEGIETQAEHAACLELGCDLGQGFLIRHPASAKDLRDTWQ